MNHTFLKNLKKKDEFIQLMELPLKHPSVTPPALAVSETSMSVQWASPPLAGMQGCPTAACWPPRPWAPSPRKSWSPRAWPWLHRATLLRWAHLLTAAGPWSPPAPKLGPFLEPPGPTQPTVALPPLPC